MLPVDSIKKLYKNYLKDPLRYLELTFLNLMLISLPSLEALKNIFLALFIIFSLWRQCLSKFKMIWGIWDLIFLIYIASAFLSSIFAGFAPGNEWRGFQGMFFWVLFGWALSHAHYKQKEVAWILWITILATLPPLAWGLIEYMVIHTKDTLQLHSVGHVNHSAIYLGIILGAALSVVLSIWRDVNLFKKLGLILLPIILFVAIIIGQSRGVFGISIICICLIILLIPHSTKIKTIAFSIFAIILTMMLIMNAGIIEKQVQNQKSNNILSDRDSIWLAGLEASRLHPLFGIGNGNWEKITSEHIKQSLTSRGKSFNPEKYRTNMKHGHNIYITTFVERGLFGFFGLLAFMMLWLLTLINNYPKFKISTQGSYVWGASLSAWIVTCGVGFVNSTFHHEHAILALLFLGLHLSFLKYHKIKVR